jgi:hypothetical protein
MPNDRYPMQRDRTAQLAAPRAFAGRQTSQVRESWRRQLAPGLLSLRPHSSSPQAPSIQAPSLQAASSQAPGFQIRSRQMPAPLHSLPTSLPIFSDLSCQRVCFTRFFYACCPASTARRIGGAA